MADDDGRNPEREGRMTPTSLRLDRQPGVTATATGGAERRAGPDGRPADPTTAGGDGVRPPEDPGAPHPTAATGRSAQTPAVPPHAAGQPWTVPDLARFLLCSDRHIRRLIATRKVRVIRLGRKVLVPDDEAQNLARKGC